MAMSPYQGHGNKPSTRLWQQALSKAIAISPQQGHGNKPLPRPWQYALTNQRSMESASGDDTVTGVLLILVLVVWLVIWGLL
jgi:hypothetical protein